MPCVSFIGVGREEDEEGGRPRTTTTPQYRSWTSGMIRFIGGLDKEDTVVMGAMTKIAGGKYRYSYTDGAKNRVKSYSGMVRNRVISESPGSEDDVGGEVVTADAGGQIKWPNDIRLVHYKIGLMIELCVMVSQFTHEGFPKEPPFQKWFHELLDNIARAIFFDCMGLRNMMCKIEDNRTDPKVRYDIILQVKGEEGHELRTVIEMKCLKTHSKTGQTAYNDYADGEMMPRLGKAQWGGYFGDGYLVNKPPFRRDQIDRVNWDRFGSCISERGAVRSIERHSMVEFLGAEPEELINRGVVILKQLVGTNKDGEARRGEIMVLGVREWTQGVQRMQSAIQEALNVPPKSEKENTMNSAFEKMFLRIGAEPLKKAGGGDGGHHKRRASGEAAAAAKKKEKKADNNEMDDDDPSDAAGGEGKGGGAAGGEESQMSQYVGGDRPKTLDMRPTKVRNREGREISLVVPIDPGVGTGNLQADMLHMMHFDASREDPRSDFQLAHWNEDFVELDFAHKVTIAKIGKMEYKDRRGALCEGWWAQLRPHDSKIPNLNGKGPVFDSKGDFFPRVPLARLMWSAVMYPEGNRWQEMIERFRESVVFDTVKYVRKDADEKTSVLSFDRDLEMLSKIRPVFVDDKEPDEDSWKSLPFPIAPKHKLDMKFTQTAPAYLLGELLASGKPHIKGHGWRFPALKKEDWPWGSDSGGAAGAASGAGDAERKKLEDVLEILKNGMKGETDNKEDADAEKLAQLAMKKFQDWKKVHVEFYRILKEGVADIPEAVQKGGVNNIGLVGSLKMLVGKYNDIGGEIGEILKKLPGFEDAHDVKIRDIPAIMRLLVKERETAVGDKEAEVADNATYRRTFKELAKHLGVNIRDFEEPKNILSRFQKSLAGTANLMGGEGEEIRGNMKEMLEKIQSLAESSAKKIKEMERNLKASQREASEAKKQADEAKKELETTKEKLRECEQRHAAVEAVGAGDGTETDDDSHTTAGARGSGGNVSADGEMEEGSQHGFEGGDGKGDGSDSETEREDGSQQRGVVWRNEEETQANETLEDPDDNTYKEHQTFGWGPGGQRFK